MLTTDACLYFTVQNKFSKSDPPHQAFFLFFFYQIIASRYMRRSLEKAFPVNKSRMINRSVCTSVTSDFKQVARTTPLKRIEKMIMRLKNISCKTTGLEKFTGANCDQIGACN